jgi:hypothetical protein
MDVAYVALARQRLRSVRLHMIARCYDEDDKSYDDYGARGIRVCEEWLSSPAAFVNWALNSGYELGLEVDREDNDGNYTPSNCRLVTRLENQRNRGKPKRRCTSRFKGVYKRRGRGGWIAGIRHLGNRMQIGEFATEEQAARAYDAKAIEIFGQFARLNFAPKQQAMAILTAR